MKAALPRGIQEFARAARRGRRSKTAACASPYLPSDSFRHDWHASPQGVRLACIECHPAGKVRSAVGAKPCASCHKDLIPAGATIKIKTYTAPAYVDAIHELCIGCHAKLAQQQNRPEVARCAECHKGNLNLSEAENLLDRRRALAGRRVVLPPKLSDGR